MKRLELGDLSMLDRRSGR